MTALGKMMVIFVFLLSIVWMAITVIGFTTAHNWKVLADKNAKAADDNYKGAEAYKKQADEEKEQLRAQFAAKLADAERQSDQIKNTVAQYTSIIEAYEAKLSQDRKNDAAIKALQETIDAKNKELAIVNTQLAAAEKTRDIAERDAKESKALKNDANNEAKSLKEQAERLTTRLQELSDKYAELQQGGSKTLTGRPVAPENFRGTVRAYKDGFVEITPGLNSGLRPGTLLKIQRLDGGGKFVGLLSIGDDLNPDKAVGTWVMPAGLKKPGADDYPKVGDEVVPSK